MTSDTKPVGFPGWRGRSLPVVPRQAQAWLWRAAVVCFAVAVLTLPIAWSVRFAAQSGWWWERGFDRFEVERRTGLERTELEDRRYGQYREFSGDATVAALLLALLTALLSATVWRRLPC